MKILVPIKRVPDPYARIKVNSAGTGIETSGIKYEINPFDEIAVEEAVRIHEAHEAEIIVVSIGPPECEEQLRKALAMGADKGLLVETAEEIDSLGVAKILSKVFDKVQPDIVIMGKQAVDDDANQAGQMLAAIRRIPQATFASKVEIVGNLARVTRETDTGQEVLEISLPAVVTTDLRLNEPRYVALPGIIKARSKQIDRLTLSGLEMQPECRVRVTAMKAPPGRSAGKRVAGTDELVGYLKEAGVM